MPVHVAVTPAFCNNCFTSLTCDVEATVITRPAAPARAVRPERWVYALCSIGGSACTTKGTSSTWIPRAAMSVATNAEAEPLAKAAKLRSRAVCDKLPCISTALIPNVCSFAAICLARCLVRVKITTRSLRANSATASKRSASSITKTL